MDYRVRIGDGSLKYLSKKEIKEDIEDGTKDAADRGEIPELTDDDKERLLEIVTEPNKIVSVSPGEEVVMTNDVGTLTIQGDQGNSGVGLPLDRIQCILTQERAFGSDTMELAHTDYSFKPVKPIIAMEQQALEQAELLTVIPVFYGAMPNLGQYYVIDGPFPNPNDLYRDLKIKEARESQEECAEHASNNMSWIGQRLWEVGCEGLNFDTTAAAGDTDFYATLTATEELKKTTSEMCIEMGMAAEYVLGMHGELKYGGELLAGLYPHQQVKVAEKAGVDIFGPVVNTNTSKSFPWNIARALTFVKECVKQSNIPIHVNMGMGVGGIPMYETPPVDAVTRASKAMVQIAHVDGI
jgi:dimethylamine--corrinoid protein Co-methyltransferase